MLASALLTDLYQLTMYGYWKTAKADLEAVFHLYFRKVPFKGGFAIMAGLADAIACLKDLHFARDDLAYLATLQGSNGSPLFEAAFLEYLGALRLTLDVDAIPEGTVVFAHEPLVRVRGPLLQGQLLETPLLNALNFPTLIATKAARVCLAARGEPVLEFGLRRAQGVDGALTASRAAYIGGCTATSNVLAGKCFGIPVGGTHAHSWVMCFDTELEAFQAYAEAMPHNCVFLVDIQNDFLPGGALPVAEGDAIVPIVNRLLPRFDLVVATQDWHPPEHGSFAANHSGRRPFERIELQGLPQTLWPVHCVQNTGGACFAPGLDTRRFDRVFPKGTDPRVDSYSGFYDNDHRHATGLAAWLRARGARELWIAGLATDYCVKFIALDAVAEGFGVHLLEEACRGVNLKPGEVDRAVEEMRKAGVIISMSLAVP